jgi:hypothetical protein
MAPRQALFQRKGPPSGKPAVTIAISHGSPVPEGSSQDNANDPPGGGEGGAEDAGEPVQCPQCGCTFDPATGEPVGGQTDGDEGPDGGQAAPATDQGSGDVNAQLAAMMGGGPRGG